MDMLDRMQTGRFKVFRHLNDWFENSGSITRDVLPAALDRPRRSLSRLDRRGGETVAVRQNFIGNFAHPAVGFFLRNPLWSKAIR